MRIQFLLVFHRSHDAITTHSQGLVNEKDVPSESHSPKLQHSLGCSVFSERGFIRSTISQTLGNREMVKIILQHVVMPLCLMF